MMNQRILIPSDGYELPVDVYVPNAIESVDANARRPAVVICPGGGYAYRSEREAEPIALRFLAEGFNAFVAHYRVAPNHYPLGMLDVAATVAYVRAHADELFTNANQIAVMGFSAGGHAAASLAAQWHKAELWQPLGVSAEAVKPNAQALCYPVITGGERAHRGSFENLTGSSDVTLHKRYSADQWVTENCPPTFLWHTFQDQAVPVENSLLMAQALAAHGVLCELHVFPYGGHGAALCNEMTSHPQDAGHIRSENAVWPSLAARFLKQVM